MDVMVLPGVDGDFLSLRKPEIQPMVVERIQTIFSTKSREDWCHALDEAAIPNAPILSREEWEQSGLVADNHPLQRHGLGRSP